jgi:hypothetical protein
MTDIVEFAMETLPSLLGLILILYALMQINRERIYFFEAARSWVMVAFMAALTVLWIFEFARTMGGGKLDKGHLYVDFTFIVTAMWLSTCMVALSSVHRRYNSIERLSVWMKEHPVNIITAWGAIAIGVLVPVWFTDLSGETALEKNGWVLILVLLYLALSIAIDAYLALRARAKHMLPRLSREMRRDMQLIAIAWMGIPVTEFFLDAVLGIRYGFEDYNPYAWVMVFLFAAIVESISSKGFTGLIVDPEVEDVKRSGFRVFDIPRGVYLVEDERPKSAFSLFSELVTLPLNPEVEIPAKAASASETLEFLIPKGLVVTREYPETIRGTYNIQVTPIIWLTEAPGEMRVAPTSLAVLTDTIIRFMESNPNSIVLVEGVEYVVTFNDFKRVLKSLDSLNETAWVTKSRLLISIDSRAFEVKELALLERDRKVVKKAEGIEDLKRESRVSGRPGR